MALDFIRASEANEILSKYKGSDSYMLYMRDLCEKNRIAEITEEMYDYVINNVTMRCVKVNKVISVSDSFAERRKNRDKLDFLPTKIYINTIVGESNSIVACMAKYRQFMTEIYMLIPKKEIISTDMPTTIKSCFYEKVTSTKYLKSGKKKEETSVLKRADFVKIDFDKYDKLSKERFDKGIGNGRYAVTLLPHQKEAIKFMVGNKKCILADGCGLGKTISTIVSALECNFQKVLIICPASIKSTWKRELTTYVNEEEISIVKGRNWNESRFTIINYDILKNFYTLAEEIKYIEENVISEDGTIVKKKSIDWKVKPKVDEDGHVIEAGIPKMKQSRNTALIEQALKNSQLYQSEFDLVIIDECHRLSNNTSKMCKIVQDLLKHLKPQGIFAISGTPMTNRPMNMYNILKLIGHPITNNWQNYVERYCEGTMIPFKGEWSKWLPSYLKQCGKSEWNDLSKSEKDNFRSYLAKWGRVVWKTNGASNLDELRELTKDCYIRRINTEIEGMVKKEIIVKEYDLNDKQIEEYNKVWEKYVKKCRDLGISVHDENRQLTEGIKLRQFLSKEMLNKTIELAEYHIENGSKVLLLCNYDEELYELHKYFSKKKIGSVIYNGKMTAEEKDKSEKALMLDDNVKVFIGNITACGVGLTLTASNIAIFNSFSWLPSDNQQAMDRVFRITQTEDVKVYFQLYNDTYLTEMWDKVTNKEKIINQVVVKRG